MSDRYVFFGVGDTAFVIFDTEPDRVPDWRPAGAALPRGAIPMEVHVHRDGNWYVTILHGHGTEVTAAAVADARRSLDADYDVF